MARVSRDSLFHPSHCCCFQFLVFLVLLLSLEIAAAVLGFVFRAEVVRPFHVTYYEVKKKIFPPL